METSTTASENAGTPAAEARWRPSREFLWVYAALMLTVFVSALDQTIVATALPTIVGSLGDVGAMSWVVTAYAVAMTITMPVYGKLGDKLGRGRMFISALILFLIGSLLCGVSTTVWQLVAFRSVQGLGGGGLMVLAQAILSSQIPPRERARYTGPIGAVFGLASVLGPIAGGFITDVWSWRWIFWINLPVGLLALTIAYRGLGREPRAGKIQFDFVGTAVMAAAVLSITALTGLPGTAFFSPFVMAAAAAATAILVGVFILVERNASDPLIPLRFFGTRNFVVPTVLGVVVALGMFATISYMPTLIQVAYGVSATVSGFLIFPMVLAMVVTGTVSGVISSRLDNYRIAPIVGVAACGVGLFSMSMAGADAPLWWIVVCLVILGGGVGATMQLLVLIAQSAVSEAEIGSATSVNNFIREIGAIIGISAVGSLFSARLLANLNEIGGLGSLARGGAQSLTPELIATLPAALRDQIAHAYTGALLPLLMGLTPIMALGLGAAFLLPRSLNAPPEREGVTPS